MAHGNFLSVALREVGNRHHQTMPMALGGLKFTVVAVYYFTKWAEAIPLSAITEKNLTKFIREHTIY